MKQLFVVGIGPGGREYMTEQAVRAMECADVICGYTVYVDLVRELFPDKEYVTTPMRQELERCQLAVNLAREGKTVAMICSGDAGVYGMAQPVLDLAAKSQGEGASSGQDAEHIEVVVVPGVSAALSGAAVLGAPLTHDFCVISLSDLLTDWEVIEKRLCGAGLGDFCIAIYNPMSKKRTDHLSRACDILLRYKSPKTVCGWVKNIGREGQESRILTLKQLRDETVDMFTTVFIGNEKTHVVAGKMVTPRGYEAK